MEEALGRPKMAQRPGSEALSADLPATGAEGGISRGPSLPVPLPAPSWLLTLPSLLFP